MRDYHNNLEDVLKIIEQNELIKTQTLIREGLNFYSEKINFYTNTLIYSESTARKLAAYDLFNYFLQKNKVQK